MKKKIFIILVLGSIIYFGKQLNLFAQTEVTRYTPLLHQVRAYNQIPEMDLQEKLDWSQWVDSVRPLATELNPHSATNSYNCHSYAWHISEGGDYVWIGYYINEQEDEDIYWTDASYIRLNSESEATKISYYNDNHSARQTSTQGIYISKWGPGPLMQHSRDYGPIIYEMDYRNYYAKPNITGSSIICDESSETYSVQDFNNVTYSWSTSSNLQINGSSNIKTVSISPNSATRQYGTITINIYVIDYDITRTLTKSVWIGYPEAPSIYPISPISQSINSTFNVNITESPGADASTGIWETICCVTPNGTPSGGSASFYSCDNNGRGVIYVSTSNKCGSYYKNIITVITGSDGECEEEQMKTPQQTLVISPNPATDFIDVLLSNQTNEISSSGSISIYDMYSRLVKKLKTDGSCTRIPISGLPRGSYILKLIDKDIFLTGKFLVK